MCSTRCAEWVIATFPSARSLPPPAQALLEDVVDLFAMPAWWDVVQTHAMPPAATAVFITIQSSGRTVAVVPALQTGNRFDSLTTPYTCTFTPLFIAGLDQPGRIAAMAAFVRFARTGGLIRIDALPREWDGLAALEAGARKAGTVPLRFDHFGNWYENVSGLDWAAYLHGRPGALRETIRRRLRRAEKLSDARFDLFARPEQMEDAAAAYEGVYRRSWKDAEPYPTFNVALMQAMAPLGLLRLGVWSIGSTPVAVQLWLVKAGHAVVLKLAHDEAFKTHSPGTVLTAMMLRYLLNNEQVTEIDFGRGDDVYKQGWATQRRQRIGLLLATPWRLAGLSALAQHMLGRVFRALRTKTGAARHTDARSAGC